MPVNPQLQAIAFLVHKFGTKIPGGGYEVTITHEEMRNMSQWGMFQEVPEPDLHQVRWQYYPNKTIEGEVVTPAVDPAYLKDNLTPEQKQAYIDAINATDTGDNSTT